jgi:ribosomal protein S18 acetylase RimI-like enzyme
VRLDSRPLRADDLPVVEPWFDDPDTRRWLGGREWPGRLLRLARAPDRLAVVYLLDRAPVALLDLERLAPANAAIAIVVSPAHRRRRVAATVLGTLFALAEVDGVDQIVAEVERGNTAAQRLVRAAGFVPERGAEPGFDRYRLTRDSAVGRE